ncbi:hypothetical protein N5F23_16310 [Pseudomonas sichuanensis]|uniref:hypothetical protein n=1 Tax=Pseudomonas TaxID=286 RepID=UPI00129A15F2|nr:MULTISPECIES: hypothetical protein [Pseudomonas]MDH0729041.1 hypothetical protein [Pseudomonas sichuanensis]MDH1584141.1 hypothetical protein [Pseudomonas sichuanensis]MDH1594789.1 hypothetical protein [Pseudomonas sichuanensis]MDH1596230.1 hypothetical protein [Pseudomonas sichuanensis]MDU9403323.1 hypothetical protein [Pseudomonas sp. zfem004]
MSELITKKPAKTPHLISERSPTHPSRQALFVNRKNKLHLCVKRLFTVMVFAVSRNQTAESCSTGGVIHASLAR